jgi:hypothetical protein
MSSTTSSNTILTNSIDTITASTALTICPAHTATATIGNTSNTTSILSGTVNLKSGAGTGANPLAGTVNIATGTGSGFVTTAVNIATGNTSTAVKIGNSQNTIELIAPVKSIRNNILYLGAITNTITETQIQTYNLFGSTYALANPSASNDNVTITLPTPSSALSGMTIVFRKMRGAISNSGTNWTFTCPTSVIVPISLTASATPTVTSLSVVTLVARFTIFDYSGTTYYFAM